MENFRQMLKQRGQPQGFLSGGEETMEGRGGQEQMCRLLS